MAEIARIQAQEEAEEARLAALKEKDAEIARQMQEGIEQPSEAQKKRMVEVQ